MINESHSRLESNNAVCVRGVINRMDGGVSEEGTLEPLEWMQWLSGQRMFPVEGRASAEALSCRDSTAGRLGVRSGEWREHEGRSRGQGWSQSLGATEGLGLQLRTEIDVWPAAGRF